MLGSLNPHICHHHSSISEGISRYRQNLYLVGGLSPLARKARRAARCAPATGWPRRNDPFSRNHSSYIWTSRIGALGTRRFCRFATKIPPFSCCFSGLNGDRKEGESGDIPEWFYIWGKIGNIGLNGDKSDEGTYWIGLDRCAVPLRCWVAGDVLGLCHILWRNICIWVVAWKGLILLK